MATSTPQQPPSSSSTSTISPSSRAAVIHNVSLGALIVCPIIILLPPRKFDIYTIGLLSCTFMGGNQLAHEHSGKSIVARGRSRMQAMSEPRLPEKAREVQVRLREERERMREGERATRLYGGERAAGELEERSRVLDEVGRLKEGNGNKEKERGLVEKVWLGGEGEDWKAKRDRREKEALEEGRGYGGLIMDQIWEVWNWGKDKAEEVKEVDEKVVEERKEKKEGKK